MGGQIENRPNLILNITQYGGSPSLCRLGLLSAWSVHRDEPLFQLNREAPWRESPLFVDFLGGGVIVAPWFGRRVDVEGGHARLHISSAGPR